MTESTADRNPFERLAEEFAARLRRGEHPSITEYVERYPEHADDIRELFPALALVEQFKPARQEHDGSLAASLPAARDKLPAQLGDYRILRYLGEGGMGVVYEAVRESLRSHVALKVMHPQYRNRPRLPPPVPHRGPFGGPAAPHQHRQRLRLWRARRRLLLRDAVHRRTEPGQGSG